MLLHAFLLLHSCNAQGCHWMWHLQKQISPLLVRRPAYVSWTLLLWELCNGGSPMCTTSRFG